MHTHTHHHYGTSETGSVMLDIGRDTGALVIYTGPEQQGLEIEISPLDTLTAARTHVAVRERLINHGKLYCAVYPSLPAGRYTVWRGESEQAGTVTIAASRVAEFSWPAN
ncbi:hypothetical protein J2S43_003856 [Catenuloplanes nepalensis]|uniref:Phospholipase n=1 Tax=Catenuloplanes nepalensis TaxID=587533 RepID=A0ABT9MV70_9ACTN|nr:phospholipase [Catenuloplanes nepalensis]MDP9795344.1 hypothetical protein [Catenuloplanes nepalensis]